MSITKTPFAMNKLILNLLIIVFSIISLTGCVNKPKPIDDKQMMLLLLGNAYGRDSTFFPGFMGLKWYTSMEEAKTFFKQKHLDLKITRVETGSINGDDIYISGKFAGQHIDLGILTFYTGKFCKANLSFLTTQDGFVEKLVEDLSKKYGEVCKSGNLYWWNVAYCKGNERIEGGQLMVTKDFDYTFIDYIAPKNKYYDELHGKTRSEELKNKMKIKDSDL